MLKDLRAQVIILSILPPALIAISIGIYLNFSYANDMENFFENHGRATASQIANITKYQLLDNNLKTLQSIAKTSLEEQGLRSVAIYDQSGKKIAHAGPRLILKTDIKKAAKVLSNEPITLKKKDIIAYLHPVTKGYLSHETHLFDREDPKDNYMGWVVVEFNTSQFDIARFHQSIRQNIILFVAFLLSIFAGFLFAQRANLDITRIKTFIKRFTEDGSKQPSKSFAINEFGQIAQLLDEMATKKNEEFGELRHNVEITSNDLQETIETIEVQNIELSIAQKEAMKASQIKSEFLANTSHEIRTPLNGIIGFTRILMKTPLSAQQLEYLETIQISSEGLLTIINDILDFSKIEANKLSLDKSPIDLRKTLEDVVSLLAPSAYEKQVEVTLIIYKDVPTQLIADPTRIKQIFFNLLSNAIKFTQKGDITIRIQLDELANQKAFLQCSIHDTGIGMSDAQQADIFKAFHQANSSISREYGGTGLGLSIVKTLIKLMQGDIKLASQQGEGTEVDFTLALDSQEKPYAESTQMLQGNSVVLIESHETTQLVTKHLLEKQGINVHPLASLDDLKDTLSLFHIDAIVYGFSSTCTLEGIKQHIDLVKQLFDKPVIVLSTLSLEHLQSIHTLGVYHCSKPVREHILERTLSQALAPDIVHEQSLTLTPQTFVKQQISALAVDDNIANLNLLSILLEDMGIQVSRAHNGQEAVELSHELSPDIIFMDIQMPILNGIEASKHIRKQSDVPIIALTAHALADEKQALLDAGMNDYLTKPVNEKQIKAAVAKWYQLSPETSDEQQQQVVNLQLCLQLAKKRPEVAEEMFNLLVDNLEKDMLLIQAQFEENALDALLESVHRLHGATCYTGTEKLKEVCLELESTLKQEAFEKVDQLVEQLSREANAVMTWSLTHDFEQEIAALLPKKQLA